MTKSISDVIHQKKFKNDYQKAYLALIYVSNQVTNDHQNHLRKYGITQTQYNALRILRGQYPNPCNANVLKDRMLDRNSDVSRLVQRLHKTELLSLGRSDNDKRHLELLISQTGLDLLAKIDQKIEVLEHPFNILDEQEVKTFVTLLEKLII